MQFINEAPNYFEDPDPLQVKSYTFNQSCDSVLRGVIGPEITMISERDIPDYMLYTMLGGRLDTAKGIVGKCNVNIFTNWALGIVPLLPRLVNWRAVARHLPATADRVSVAKYLVHLVEIIELTPVLSLGRKVIDSWFAVAAMTDDMMLLDYLLGEGYGTNSHLRFFVGYGRAELIQRMLDHGFDGRGSHPYHKLILSFDRCSNLPSLLSTKDNEDVIFNLLLNDIGGALLGFDLEEINEMSLSPFSFAVRRGDLTLAKLLLRTGINLNNFHCREPALWVVADNNDNDDTDDDDNAHSVEEDEDDEDSDGEIALDEFANRIDDWDDCVHEADLRGGNYVHMAIHSRFPEMVAFIRDAAAPLLPGSWLFSVNYQTHVVLPPIEHAANLATTTGNAQDAEADALEVMKEVLLFKDIDVNLVPLRKLSIKKTILHTLFKCRYPPSLLQLILEDKRVDVNARDANGRTPMHFAIHASWVEAEGFKEVKLNMLLCFDRSSDAPLGKVVKYFEDFDFRSQSYDEGDYPIVAINPNDRADCETRDHSGMTPIQMDGYDVNILRPRIRTASVNADGSLNVTWQRGCDPNKRFVFRDPSIFDSVHKPPSLIAHLRYGANVDSVRFVSGQTPLQDFLTRRSGDCTTALLSVMPLLHFGSSVSHRDADGRTALHLFATWNWPTKGVTTALTNFGVDLDARDKNGRTPLHVACSGNNISFVGWLLGEGADPNIADSSGWTPLHTAATNCYNDCVSILIEGKADPNAKTNTGKTPLHCLARCLKNVDEPMGRRMIQAPVVAENLISHGCDPTVLDVSGFNAMHLAGVSGNSEVVDYLLNDPNDPSTHRCSAHPGSASVCHALCRCLPNNAAQSVLNAALLTVRKKREGAKRNREQGQSIDEQQSRADAEAVQPVPRTE